MTSVLDNYSVLVENNKGYMCWEKWYKSNFGIILCMQNYKIIEIHFGKKFTVAISSYNQS